VSVLLVWYVFRGTSSLCCYYHSVGDVPDLTADPTLAEAELGFSAPRDLETMCRDLWNWQTKNPQGYDTPHTSPRVPASPVATLEVPASIQSPAQPDVAQTTTPYTSD
jgi:hypothetical protein